MNFRLLMEYPELSSTETSLAHLLLQIETPPVSGADQRQPLVVGLAIDKSKSMYGEKISSTREAAASLVNWLTRHDNLAIIAYDSQVEVVQPLIPLSDKFSVIKKLEGIEVGTSTNLSGGWLQALRSVEDADIQNGYRRVILLTDGMANTGVVSTSDLIKIAADHYARGISTTTIGFGRDFSENLLREIARAGGGNFYFIEGPEQAHEVFFKEFGDIAALFGQGLEVRLRTAPGVQIKELLNDVPHSTNEAGEMVLRPGDLRSDDLRNIVLVLEVEGATVNAQVQAAPLISAELSFYNMLEGSRMEKYDADVMASYKPKPSQNFNKNVRLEALLAASGRAMIEASRIASEKDLSAARDILTRMIRRLEQNLELEPTSLERTIRRLHDMERNLEENLNLTRKHLMAGGAELQGRSYAQDMHFAGHVHNRILELPLNGQLDLYRCPDLKAEIKTNLDGGYRYLIFDLTDLNYIDSSGIGTLIQISNWMRKRGGVMLLVNTQGSVEKIFQMSKLDEFFVFRDSVVDARSYLEDTIQSSSDSQQSAD